jgi:sortase A
MQQFLKEAEKEKKGNKFCRKSLAWAEVAFLLAGFGLLAVFFGQKAYEKLFQSYQEYRFEQEREGRQASAADFIKRKAGLSKPDEAPAEPAKPEAKTATTRKPALAQGEIVGRIVIPRIGVSAMVQEGVDKKTLSRAVGHVPSTSLPGYGGNVALAAHRDTHFRPVKNLKVGDRIEMETAGATYKYRVEKMWIVSPKDVSVLKPTPGPALTLITCYPFQYVGHAPKRYIVRATQLPGEEVARAGAGKAAALAR